MYLYPGLTPHQVMAIDRRLWPILMSTLLFLLLSTSLGVTVAQINDTRESQYVDDQRHFASLKAELENQRREMKQQFQLMFEMLKASTNSQPLFRSRKSVEAKPLPRDCYDLLASAVRTSGVYTVHVVVGRLRRPVQVYCDMNTEGGGWTLIQRRQDGKENFCRPWNEYANGFGNVAAEFWLGNDAIHWMTSSRNYRLRFDLGDWNGNFRYAEYDNFKVGSGCEKYRLSSVGKYCGTAGDSFNIHSGQKFSTLDQDNDPVRDNCAQQYKGGWWYNSCYDTNLNGLYLKAPFASTVHTGITWRHWYWTTYSLKLTEMKIRPNDM